MAVGSTATSSKTVQARQDLITKVVQVYGAPDDAELRGVAEGFLDDTIREMNSHLYEFNKKVLSNVSLTADTPEVVLNNDVYKEHLAYLHKTADDQNQKPLTYLPYTHFKKLYGDESQIKSGTPFLYTFRSVHQDYTLHLAPAPSSSIATDYTLTVEYYRRIPLVGENSQLDVPPEVQTALIYGAQKRMAIHIHADASHSSVPALHALEQDALKKLKSIDSHHPDTNKRFRMVDHLNTSRGNTGAIYIKVE